MGAFSNENIEIHELNIKEESFMEYINSVKNPFHIIIDDALHQAKQQFLNFINLFSKLSPGGIYVVEDLEKPKGVIDFFKDIIIGVASRKEIHMSPSLKTLCHQNTFLRIISQIESVEVRKNMIVIKKL